MNQVSDWQLYKRLLMYVKPFWFFFVLHIIGFSFFSASNVGFAHLLKMITASLLEPKVADVWLIPFAVVIIALARSFGLFVGNYCLGRVSHGVIHSIRCQLFGHLLTLPVKYFDSNNVGQHLSKVTYHVTQVTDAASSGLKVIVREGLTVIGLFAYLLYLNWLLTLAFVVIMPFIAGVVFLAGKRFRQISKRLQQAVGNITQIATEAIQGHRVMRIFGGYQSEQRRFGHESDFNRKQSMKMIVVRMCSTAILQLLVAGAMASILVFAYMQMQAGQFDKDAFLAFFAAAGLMAKPLRQLSEVHGNIQKGLAAAQDMFAVLDEQPEQDLGVTPIKHANGQIQFDNVDFFYASDKPVLKGINFEIKAGETVALVGASGGGKTTLVSLLSRFYACTSGHVLVDGVDIQDYCLADYRQQLSMVSQNVVLFNDTVFNNIAYGMEGQVSEDAVIVAARAAHAMTFIDQLPQGLNTMIGDDGVLLSGGQRQRLAIARAILKDAPILILDEATSALDNESEHAIQEALEALMKGRTSIVIAHRLSTIENADRILVVEAGQIVEQGSHQDLLALGQRYAKLYLGDE